MERTYVFNQEPSSGGGNKFDIMAMLPNLMGGKGVDPNLMALLSQGRNNQDQWGGSWWFIWIILLWFCWGGNGFGFGENLNVMRGREDIDELIDRTDNIPYMDYCRLLSVLYWNL